MSDAVEIPQETSLEPEPAHRGPNGGFLFRKRPVDVEMMQMDSENYDELKTFANHLIRYEHEGERYFVYDRLHDAWIPFQMGDWIARGGEGEFYPIKESVQRTTYTPSGVS